MGWTLNWDTGDQDWHSVENCSDFLDACTERARAWRRSSSQFDVHEDSAVGPGITVIRGSDVQSSDFWKSIQTCVHDNYREFVVSHSNGVELSSDYYDNTSPADFAPKYSDMSDMFSAAGLGADRTTWRRYTTHPDDGGSDLEGKMKRGDIIGPWIFEDLQKCLNVMVWTLIPPSGKWDGRNLGVDVCNLGFGVHATDITIAQSDAKSDWDSGDNLSDWIGPASPAAYSLIKRVIGLGRTARLVAYKARYDISDIYSDINRAADFFIYTMQWGAWDDNDDDVIQDRFSHWLTDNPATINDPTIVSSTYFGDLVNYPNWPDSFDPDDYEMYPQGWVGIGPGDEKYSRAAILRWNVPGGFEFQSDTLP